MMQFRPPALERVRRNAASIMIGPPGLAFLPALCLAGFWFGGEGTLMAIAGLVPITYLVIGGTLQRNWVQPPLDGVHDRAAFDALIENINTKAHETGRQSALFAIGLEDYEGLTERYGQSATDSVIRATGERIATVLRATDVVGQLGDARFGVCMAPVRHLDLESCIQLAGRIQTAIEEPISVDGMVVYVTSSVGFCMRSRVPEKLASDWTEAASTALREAQRRGPSAIRAYSDEMRRDTQHRAAMREEVSQALDGGQIQPWFQPQISTETGQVTGFEALARWSHPTRGMISPAEFLPAIEQAGLLERLAEVMMYHAFAALKAWDGSGVLVPQVGVNFAGSELSNPRLVEKIRWELDRFDLGPERLAVEVLETVVAHAPDDMITRNIIALGDLGCRVDLDDFGTGNASIASIRRFSVGRIKIDRSFVMKADRDPEQQRMISAILTMAERLGVETLAEGVESVGEHALLAQLGCDHVQGYGVARPMPFEQTLDWIERHNAKLRDMPRIMNGPQH